MLCTYPLIGILNATDQREPNTWAEWPHGTHQPLLSFRIVLPGQHQNPHANPSHSTDPSIDLPQWLNPWAFASELCNDRCVGSSISDRHLTEACNSIRPAPAWNLSSPVLVYRNRRPVVGASVVGVWLSVRFTRHTDQGSVIRGARF